MGKRRYVRELGMVSLALLLAGCAHLPGQGDGRLVAEHDQSNHRTQYTVLNMELGASKLRMYVRGVRKDDGDPQHQVGIALLAVNPVEDGWQYLLCHRVEFVADGQPINIELVHYQQGIHAYSLMEAVGSLVQLREFAKIANASEVRGELCQTKFTLTHDQLIVLHAFYKRVTGGFDGLDDFYRKLHYDERRAKLQDGDNLVKPRG